VSGNAV
jgi:hypothetical protein